MDSTAHPRRHHIVQRSLLLPLAFCLSLLLAGCDFFGVSAPSANNSPTAITLTTVQPSPSLAPFLPDVSVFAAMQDGTITAFDAASGIPRWQTKPGGGGITSLVIANQTLYISNSGISALRPNDGSLLWQTNQFTGQISTEANGILYLTGDNLTALDTATGKLLWQVQRTVSAVTVANGQVYLQSPYASVSAVSATTGNDLWNTQTPAATQVVAVESGLVYTIAPTTGLPSDSAPTSHQITSALIALSASTGRERWRFPRQPAFVEWIGMTNGNIFLLSDDGTAQPNGVPATNILYALNASTGAVRWRTPIPNTVFAEAQLINGIIAAATTTGAIEAFSASQGTPLWTQQPGQNSTLVPSLAVFNGTLYVQHNGLFALDPATGATQWQAPLQDETLRPFALTNNILFLATAPFVNQGKENSIIALNNTDGTTRWQFTSAQFVPPPVLG